MIDGGLLTKILQPDVNRELTEQESRSLIEKAMQKKNLSKRKRELIRQALKHSTIYVKGGAIYIQDTIKTKEQEIEDRLREMVDNGDAFIYYARRRTIYLMLTIANELDDDIADIVERYRLTSYKPFLSRISDAIYAYTDYSDKHAGTYFDKGDEQVYDEIKECIGHYTQQLVDYIAISHATLELRERYGDCYVEQCGDYYINVYDCKDGTFLYHIRDPKKDVLGVQAKGFTSAEMALTAAKNRIPTRAKEINEKKEAEAEAERDREARIRWINQHASQF